VLFLLAVYGFILFKASNLISDGSELLLLVPSLKGVRAPRARLRVSPFFFCHARSHLAGIVGSVVLPILGAVPDGAIVLFSGLGPDAQSQVNTVEDKKNSAASIHPKRIARPPRRTHSHTSLK
jgi:hypothetical protein